MENSPFFLWAGLFPIVGDPKQSIYGFRNADVRVFNSVKSKLATENSNGDLVLNESFRFKKAISNFVNLIFPNILQLDPSNLWEVEYHKVATKFPIQSFQHAQK